MNDRIPFSKYFSSLPHPDSEVSVAHQEERFADEPPAQENPVRASHQLDTEALATRLEPPGLEPPPEQEPEAQLEKISQSKVISLRVQLLRSILPILLVPLVVASAIGYRVVQQRTEERIQRQLEDQALLTSEGTSAVLEELLDIPRTIASNPLVINEALAGSRQVEESKLNMLSTQALEDQFKQSKTLRTHRALNAYLKETADTADISEILITERYGLNVAYSGSPTDFVQNDEAWWQNGANEGLWIGPPDFDFAAKGFTIELAQGIKDWNSGQFAGVVRVVLPARKFSLIANYVQRTGISGSQRVQLIDAAELSVIDTFSPQGFRRKREIIGGDAVSALAAALREAQQNETDPTQAVRNLARQYSLRYVNLNTTDKILVSFQHQGRQYKLVMIPQTNWVAIASMEAADISSAGRDLLLLFAGTALLLGGVTTGGILLLSRQLTHPIWALSNTAEQVASGDLNVVAQPSGTRETQTLARTFNSLLERVRSLLQRQKTETHKAQLFAEITSFSVESVSDLQPVFSHALDGIRDILAIEYAALYWICPTGRGSLAVQSMQPGWAAASNWAVAELQLSPEQFAAYQSGQITTTDRITEAGFSSDYQQQLQELGINFSLVLPVLTAEGLFGLLVAHRHTGKQDWTTSEIHTLQQLLSQLKLVIERVTALDQNREARRTAEALSEEQRRQKEQLQQQVLTLIHEVESVSQGDLTVRATLTEDEIGKVANFLNFTIASLQTLVTQVKDASTQVNTYLQQNEQSVSQLASEAKQQTHQTTRSLDSVQQIQHAIQLIAESAHQAADVAHRVSAVAQTGGLSMDHTTQKIMDLQQTIMSAAKKVARLGNSSQNISQITGLLKEVALQMTTLSNHTNSEVPLETSQDGTEASQQFAAIAEKFKYLAGRTVEATHPIEQFLETIQRETRQVVEAMEQVTAQMLEGAHLVQESKQSLSQMLEVSHQIDQLAHSISEATGSQVQTTQSVASLMQEIAQLSERTSDFSGQLAEALHQTVAVAQDLQASVKTFKVTS